MDFLEYFYQKHSDDWHDWYYILSLKTSNDELQSWEFEDEIEEF
jgi:hypothetical protein